MAGACRLYVGIVAALALCKHSLAGWNATDGPANRTVSHCHRHGNRDNCTANSTDAGQWDGHFSTCPDELRNYCVHGECRYVKEQQAPSCRCQRGFSGARCEYVDLDWRIGDRRQIIIISCVIAVLVLLVLLVVLVCICSHRRLRLCCRRRRRRREEPRNGTEKLGMMDAGGAGQADLSPDAAEPTP